MKMRDRTKIEDLMEETIDYLDTIKWPPDEHSLVIRAELNTIVLTLGWVMGSAVQTPLALIKKRVKDEARGLK